MNQLDEIVEAELNIYIIYLFTLLFLKLANSNCYNSVLAYNNYWFSYYNSLSFSSITLVFSPILFYNSRFLLFSTFDCSIS